MSVNANPTPEEILEQMRTGKPVAEVTSKIIFDSFLARTYYQPKRSKFHYLNLQSGEYQEFSEDLFLKFMVGEGFFDQIYSTR